MRKIANHLIIFCTIIFALLPALSVTVVAQSTQRTYPGNRENVPQVVVDRDVFFAVLRVVRWAEACDGSCRTVIIDSGVRRAPLPDSLTDSGVVVRLSRKVAKRLSTSSRQFSLGRFENRPISGDTALIAITISRGSLQDDNHEFLIYIHPASNWGAAAWVQVTRKGKLWRAVLVKQDVS